MGLYMNDKGFICYERAGYSPTGNHGGHEAEHKADMEAIANERANKKIEKAMQAVYAEIPKLVTDVCINTWNSVSSEILGAFTTHTYTSVDIALNDGVSILNSAKTRTIITNAIAQAARAELSKIKIPTIYLNL